jgi:hypothetical protein
MLAPHTVAAIVRALRHVHGDDIARAMLTNGTTLAALIDALLHSPLTNRDAVKLMTQALRSNDFIVTPDFGSVWHIKYVYDRPKSLNVVDLAVITLDHGTFASTNIRVLLAIDRVVKQRGMDDAVRRCLQPSIGREPHLISGMSADGTKADFDNVRAEVRL